MAKEVSAAVGLQFVNVVQMVSSLVVACFSQVQTGEEVRNNCAGTNTSRWRVGRPGAPATQLICARPSGRRGLC